MNFALFVNTEKHAPNVTLKKNKRASVGPQARKKIVNKRVWNHV